ncbi:glycosyltransferase family 4 protein [Flavivirga jejuensis]|uniref:Glycosyltransferase family 4 protein n=1 Tax=Flavivirga jejuensis TaxID=870487 RepID=A0ABT8WSD2_9FLAO|nr:glycosyltransferase family 4 protein [Flavivirga jejuensis]MDO5975791.1 glycosyltransferase family 4 protein [Flavivirga jejuensis]
MAHKILYITNGISGPGGLERVLSIKASYLADNFGYEVHIISLNEKNSAHFYTFSQKIICHNIETKGGHLSYLYSYLSGIKKVIKEIKPDVISVCDDGLKGLFAPLLIGKPCPMIYERHVSRNIEIKKDATSYINKVFTFFKFNAMNFGGKLFDNFVVLTNGNKKEWELNNLLVIPNPLSFFPDSTQLSNLENKKVLAVGKHSFQKGYDRLINSWKDVSEKHPDWELDIYGTINENVGLKKLAKSLKLDDCVNLFPPEKNIGEKYKEASIYAMSSRYEGFGMVLTEAMAYGVPCISFDCPFGPSDIISHNENGIIVENGNIKDLSDSIIRLIDDSELRKSMGQKARIDVERYLPEKVVYQWDQLFQSLISKSLK